MPLGQRAGDASESRYCGAELGFSPDIQAALAATLAGAFDFAVAPLTDPSYRPSAAPPGAAPPFAGSDLVLAPAQWSSHVVGKISEWADLDHRDAEVRRDSEAVLKQELSWASHLSLQASCSTPHHRCATTDAAAASVAACLLPTPRPLDCTNYARGVNQLLQGLSNMQLWLRIPLVAPELQAVEGTADEDAVFLRRDAVSRRPLSDPWEWWHAFCTLCEHHSQLSVALDITASLPSPSALQRWLGEPVRAAILHTSAFLTNKRGFPCLSKRHQALVATLFEHSVQVVVSGETLHAAAGVDGPANSESSENASETADNRVELMVPKHPLRPYLEYVAHLYRKLEPLSEQERFEMGYRDFLQAPLQPLMDNLEAQTYETFEKDAKKYSQYQQAVHQALLDKVTDADSATTTLVLMVVGAGRGPLVRASLAAAEEAQRLLKIYAVEKNPNAIVTLHSLITMEGWQDKVTVVSSDMRHWQAPEQADILGDTSHLLLVVLCLRNLTTSVVIVSQSEVSELLGSFGDNELSPECLDGAQRFLKPDGISIPSSYTSFIGPITAAKLHNDVKAYNDLAHFETAYVVKLHSAARLAEPRPVFTFEHPNWAPVIDNRQYTRLLFDIPADTGSAVVHGFGGYFDAVLYKDVHLGIVPSTATADMFSWFAIFFPLRHPMYIPAGSKLELHFWRCHSPTKVTTQITTMCSLRSWKYLLPSISRVLAIT
eukprot:SM000023S07651  [mRNA]  locus=s23:659320:666064:- [translate_table: standard]